MQGSYIVVSLTSRLESNKEEEDLQHTLPFTLQSLGFGGSGYTAMPHGL